MAKSSKVNIVSLVKQYVSNLLKWSPSFTSIKTDLKIFIGLFIFAAVLFSPSLRFLPVYDDGSAVFENRDVRPESSTLENVFTDDFWGAGMNSEMSNTQWRPLTVLTFRMDYIRGCLGPYKKGEKGRRDEYLSKLMDEKKRLEEEERKEELALRRSKKEAAKGPKEPEAPIPLEDSKYVDVKNKKGNMLPMPGFSVLKEELLGQPKPTGDIRPEDNDEIVLRKLGWMYLDRPAIYNKPDLGKKSGASKERLTQIQKRLTEISSELANPSVQDPPFDFLQDCPCVRSFRWTTLFMHAFACAMVYVTGRLVADLGVYPSAFAAILFTVHPVHLESISTLYGRADIFCADLMLIAVNLASGSALLSKKNAATESQNKKPVHKTKPRRNEDDSDSDSDSDDENEEYSSANAGSKQSALSVFMLFCAYIFAILSIGTKEIGLASVAILPLIHWAASGRRLPSFALLACALCAIALTLGIRKTLVHRWTPPITWFDNPYLVLPPTRLGRALSYAHIHACYLLYLFAPITHAPNYGYDSIPPVLSISDPRNLGTVAAYAVVGLAALAILYTKDWKSLLLYVWAGGVFLPSSNIFFPVGTAFADRLLYIPSIPVCLLVARIFVSASEILRKLSEKEEQKNSKKRALKRVMYIAGFKIEVNNHSFVVLCAAVALVAIAMGVTVIRLPQWETPEKVWSSVAKQLPNNILAHNNLAVEYMQQGRIKECMDVTKEVLRIYEESPFPIAREHSVYITSQNMYKRLLSTYNDIQRIKSMPYAEVVQETNGYIQALAKEQNIDNMYKAQVRCMAILSSGYLQDQPAEEDAIANALTRIDVFNHIGREAYNLIHRTIIPRRIRKFGDRNLFVLRSLENSARSGQFDEPK